MPSIGSVSSSNITRILIPDKVNTLINRQLSSLPCSSTWDPVDGPQRSENPDSPDGRQVDRTPRELAVIKKSVNSSLEPSSLSFSCVYTTIPTQSRQ